MELRQLSRPFDLDNILSAKKIHKEILVLDQRIGDVIRQVCVLLIIKSNIMFIIYRFNPKRDE
jgi:hypothetical protein